MRSEYFKNKTRMLSAPAHVDVCIDGVRAPVGEAAGALTRAGRVCKLQAESLAAIAPRSQ